MGETVGPVSKYSKDQALVDLQTPPTTTYCTNSWWFSRLQGPFSNLLRSFRLQWSLLDSPHWLCMFQSQKAGWFAPQAFSQRESFLQRSIAQVPSSTYFGFLLISLGSQLRHSCQQAGICPKIWSQVCHQEMVWQLWLPAQPPQMAKAQHQKKEAETSVMQPYFEQLFNTIPFYPTSIPTS